MKYLLLLLTLSYVSVQGQFTNDSNYRYLHYDSTQFRQTAPFALPDTLVKCRIEVLTYQSATQDFTKKVINGWCLCQRPEQGWNPGGILPPFGVDGWDALLQWGRVYRIVRVVKFFDKGNTEIPATLYWSHKLFNWN